MAFRDKDDWLKEYTEFSQIDADNIEVPDRTYKSLRARLFPNPWLVFGKVVGVHAVVGYLSLAVCNQFGLNPFQTEQSLTGWFMKTAGHNLCMLLCGVFFMMTTYIIANFWLTLEELESVRSHEWLQSSVIGLISLAAFHFFGADLVTTFALLWIAGALIGGFLTIEGSYQIRKSVFGN